MTDGLDTQCPREATYVMSFPNRPECGTCLVCSLHKKRIGKAFGRYAKFEKVAGVGRVGTCEQMVIPELQAAE